MPLAYIGLGCNLDDKLKNLNTAIRLIGQNSNIKLLKRSSVYHTEPVGPKDQPDFLNMALELETILSPVELLDFLQKVEKNMGRKRGKKWGPRNIDLDLLLYENQVISSPELTLPHSQMHLRKFVLAPLAEIAKDKIHPVLKKNMAQLLEELREESKVQLFRN